jgi:hypothetical protein
LFVVSFEGAEVELFDEFAVDFAFEIVEGVLFGA